MSLIESQNIKQINYLNCYLKIGAKKRCRLQNAYVTTDSNHQHLIADNKLNRDFYSMKLGEKWVSDITYIRVNDDWNYLTTIIDLADRKVVGWSLSEDMTTKNTVMEAWINAKKTRNISNGFIFHQIEVYSMHQTK